MDNLAFGTTEPGLTIDRDALVGWGKRRYNWQFAAGVQQEILPRVSIDVGYFRTSFGNLPGVIDRAVTVDDFETFSITAPVDPRLPGGGGYVISGLYDRRPDKFSVPADAAVVRMNAYGRNVDVYDGYDFTINARPRGGLLVTGGTSTQRRTTDSCDVVDQVGPPPARAGRLTPFNPPALLPGRGHVSDDGEDDCRLHDPALGRAGLGGDPEQPRPGNRRQLPGDDG